MLVFFGRASGGALSVTIWEALLGVQSMTFGSAISTNVPCLVLAVEAQQRNGESVSDSLL